MLARDGPTAPDPKIMLCNIYGVPQEPIVNWLEPSGQTPGPEKKFKSLKSDFWLPLVVNVTLDPVAGRKYIPMIGEPIVYVEPPSERLIAVT